MARVTRRCGKGYEGGVARVMREVWQALGEVWQGLWGGGARIMREVWQRL